MKLCWVVCMYSPTRYSVWFLKGKIGYKLEYHFDPISNDCSYTTEKQQVLRKPVNLGNHHSINYFDIYTAVWIWEKYIFLFITWFVRVFRSSIWRSVGKRADIGREGEARVWLAHIVITKQGRLRAGYTFDYLMQFLMVLNPTPLCCKKMYFDLWV